MQIVLLAIFAVFCFVFGVRVCVGVIPQTCPFL